MIAAVVILLVAAVSWVGYLFAMEKYDPSLDSGPAVFTVPALPVVEIGVPLLRDADDPVRSVRREVRNSDRPRTRAARARKPPTPTQPLSAPLNSPGLMGR